MGERRWFNYKFVKEEADRFYKSHGGSQGFWYARVGWCTATYPKLKPGPDWEEFVTETGKFKPPQ